MDHKHNGKSLLAPYLVADITNHRAAQGHHLACHLEQGGKGGGTHRYRGPGQDVVYNSPSPQGHHHSGKGGRNQNDKPQHNKHLGVAHLAPSCPGCSIHRCSVHSHKVRPAPLEEQQARCSQYSQQDRHRPGGYEVGQNAGNNSYNTVDLPFYGLMPCHITAQCLPV